uniref:Go coupled opsin 1 n=1 Tax=Platynereis dumerilii TaxID=6359 RepID=A0A0K0YBE3_PLADU|nr:Go coupled opsin 1 [Platynereis dumerilii]
MEFNHTTEDSYNSTFDFITYGTHVEIYKRPDIQPRVYMVIGVYLTIAGIISTVGNSVVIGVVVKNKELRKQGHNILLLNLAICDLGFTFVGYPLTASSAFAQRWLFGHLGCVIYGFCCTVLALTDINILMALSIYRYIVICKPHIRHILHRRTVAAAMVTSCWVYSLLWGVAALVGWNRYTNEAFGTSCSIDWTARGASDLSYTILMIFFCYISHIIVMTFCYYKIKQRSSLMLSRLRNHHKFSAEDAVLINNIRNEKRLTVMTMVMVGGFILVWSPYAWVAVWKIVVPDGVPDWLTTFPTMFAKATPMLNPLIYVSTNRKFRREARGMLRRWCCCFSAKVDDIVASAIRNRQASPKEKRVYFVNMTKEGIYTGKRRVSLPTIETIF